MLNGRWDELGNEIPAWDYATELTFRRTFAVDENAVYTDCKLGEDVRLGMSVCWHATGTNRRGAFTTVEVQSGHATVIGTLPGAELGGQLHLRSQLVLADQVERSSPLSPRRPGSILWSDTVSVHLEGGAAMFPIEVVDFSATGVAPPTACWYLDWSSTDLETATLGSVRLYINSTQEHVLRAAANPEADATATAITSMLRYDILRQLIEGGLDASDFDEHIEYPLGSLGASVRFALRLAFGSNSVETVRALRRTSRSEFEARIQVAAGLFSR